MYKVKIVTKNIIYKTNSWFQGFMIIKIKKLNWFNK